MQKIFYMNDCGACVSQMVKQNVVYAASWKYRHNNTPTIMVISFSSG